MRDRHPAAHGLHVVERVAAVREQHGDHLGEVEHAAAADAEHDVGAVAVGFRGDRAGQLDRRLAVHSGHDVR